MPEIKKTTTTSDMKKKLAEANKKKYLESIKTQNTASSKKPSASKKFVSWYVDKALKTGPLAPVISNVRKRVSNSSNKK